MPQREFVEEVYKIIRSDAFVKWYEKLRDQKAKSVIAARLALVRAGNLGDHKTIDGLLELRIFYGPGYRLYCIRRKNTVIVVLCGGDKDSQERDIEKAKKMMEAYDDQVQNS